MTGELLPDRPPRAESVYAPIEIDGPYIRQPRQIRLGRDTLVCSRCETELPLSEFYDRGQRCRMCDRLSRYRMTRHDYYALLAAQGGGCAVCGSLDPFGKGSFHVDHDHSCCPGERTCGECVRGLLCHFCNFMLGNAKDTPDVLRAGADYLEKFA